MRTNFTFTSVLLVTSLVAVSAQPTRSPRAPVASTSATPIAGDSPTNKIRLAKRGGMSLKRSDGSVDWSVTNVRPLLALVFPLLTLVANSPPPFPAALDPQAHLARVQTKYARSTKNMKRNAPIEAAKVLSRSNLQPDAPVLARRAWETPDESLEWDEDEVDLVGGGLKHRSERLFSGSAGVIRGGYKTGNVEIKVKNPKVVLVSAFRCVSDQRGWEADVLSFRTIRTRRKRRRRRRLYSLPRSPFRRKPLAPAQRISPTTTVAGVRSPLLFFSCQST